MKKKITAIAVCIFMLMQCMGVFAYGIYPDSVQDTELIENGGFEKGNDGWWLAGVFSVGSTARSGSKGLQFVKSDTAYKATKAKTILNVQKNTDYTLRYFYKQVSGTHYVKILNSDNSEITSTNISAVSTDWKNNKVSFNSGDNTKVILEVMDWSSVAPEYYLDDFTITNDNVPTPVAKKNTLINGGFEMATDAYNFPGWTRSSGWYLVRNYGWGIGNEFLRSGDTFLYHDPNNGIIYTNAYQDIVLEANKKYELSYWHNVKAESYMLKIQLDGTSVTEKTYGTTNGFEKVTHTITTGNSEQTLRIVFMTLNKKLQMSVDDVNLKVINPDPIKETIMNGDMEGGFRLTDSVSPLYWQDGWFGLTDTDKHSGSYSMRITSDLANFMCMKQNIEVEPNTDYTLEWYEKRQNGGYIVKVPNTTVANDGMILEANNSNQWVKQTITFNSLDNTSVQINFTKYSVKTETVDETKTIYLDDIKLTRNSAKVENVEVSGYPAEGKKLFAMADISDDYNTLNGVKYQWQVSDNGSEWTDIQGATSDTYLPADLTKYYRVKATAEFGVLFNADKDLAESLAVYSDAVSASDKESFENDLVTEIELDISYWDKTDKLELRDKVTVAREYGIDSLVGNIATFEENEANFVEIKDSTIAYEGEDVTITLNFKGSPDRDKITKENIVLTCAREAIDYDVEAVVENEKVSGAVIKFKNEMTTADNYQLSVNIGTYCKLDEIYTVSKPVTLENVLLKNSSGEIVDRPSDITDGKLTFTADVKNNTYIEGKAVKIITAVYNGNRLYGAKMTDTTVAFEGIYNLNVTMDIPTEGLTENWTTKTFVWGDDMISPLVKKNSKSFGIDAIKDTTKDITVAFIGGSITQGKNYTDPFVEKWQQERTGKITMINAGIGGTTSSYGTMRMYEDVLSKNPDMVFVEFTLNDAWLSEAQTKKNVESMIRQVYNSEHQPVISFIHIPDRRTNTDGSYALSEKIGYYNTAMAYYGLTPFNAHQLVADAIEAEGSSYTWDSFVSAGNVHPDATQGANIATIMFDDFKENFASYVKNIKWNPEKGFGSDDYSAPSIVSSAKAVYDSNWKNNTVDGVVTEGYGVPTKIPFESFMASSIAGAKMSFKFSGTKLIISSLMGKLGKSATYTITNDEGVVEKSGTLSTYIADYSWYENIMLSVDGLEDTKHTLNVTVKDGDGLFGIGEFWIDE